MIEKNRKYTYEELKRIYQEAQKVALDEMTSDMEKTIENENKNVDSFTKLMFSMQNMMATAALYRVLFKGEEE